MNGPMPRDDGAHVPSKAVYFFVVPGFADWEAAHALAELRRHGGYEVQVVGFTREPVSVDGRLSGRVTSGGYGYTVARSIAYAYLQIGDAAPGTAVTIDIFGEKVPGTVVAEPVLPSGGRP